MADKNYYGNQGQVNVTPGITVTYNYNRLKNKIKLGELAKGKLQAVDKITEDIPDGDFVFKKMEDK